MGHIDRERVLKDPAASGWTSKARSGQADTKRRPDTRRATLRGPVLALRRASDAASAQAACRSLKEALLTAEETDEAVDGPLLGMAAAQAVRLGLHDVMESLCAYVWCRLTQCGGREVAEITAAAIKMGCDDRRLLTGVVQFCFQSPGSFSCLRDVAQLATALLRKQGQQGASGYDLALAFHGLAQAALPHLGKEPRQSPRDLAEILYSLAQVLGLRPLGGGPALCETPVAAQVVTATIASVRPQLHRCSAQDLAKVAGAAATAWTQMPQLQVMVLKPFLLELAQAVRFRHDDFNAQDISLTVVAFAKVDVLDDIAADILGEQVQERISVFSSKEFSLLLWVCARPSWVSTRCARVVAGEVVRRDLSTFGAQDLCMAAQALAKLGDLGKAPLCLVFGELFRRQTKGCSSSDKALLLWALAKSKVVHLALSRLLVRHLAVESCHSWARDVASACLWALAVLWQSLPSTEVWWQNQLLAALLFTQPWLQAPAYEVANAAWALAQLPQDLVLSSWASLLATSASFSLQSFATHELCNLLVGLAACPEEASDGSHFVANTAAEVLRRCEGGESLSLHDWHALDGGLGKATAKSSEVQRLKELVQLHLDATSRQRSSQVRARRSSRERSTQRAPPVASTGSSFAAAASDGPGLYSRSASASTPEPEAKAYEPPPGPPGFPSGWHGHGHGHGHSHEAHSHQSHGHEDGEECDHCSTSYASSREGSTAEAAQEAHGISKTQSHESCCPGVFPHGQGPVLRLNNHCAYSGHCVQLKHTFIHVECSALSDSEDDCALCTLTRRRRARSLDGLDVLGNRKGSPPSQLVLSPPPIFQRPSSSSGSPGEHRQWQ